MVTFKGKHFDKNIILMGIRWYVAYALSYRDIEEMLKERGITIDHATLKTRKETQLVLCFQLNVIVKQR